MAHHRCVVDSFHEVEEGGGEEEGEGRRESWVGLFHPHGLLVQILLCLRTNIENR